MKFEELEHNILQWAFDRDILSPDNDRNQLLKAFEELGETARAELKNQPEAIKDGIGDTIVTLIIYATQNGFNITQCLEAAYNEIKDRKGTTVNGTFIKS